MTHPIQQPLIDAGYAPEQDLKLLDPCNIFVKYLPSDLRDADLSSLFQPYGTVQSSKIMLDPVTRQSLGFGFVRYSSPTEAQTAISKMDGHRIGAKRLLCKLANSGKTRDLGVTVSAGKQSSDDGSSPSMNIGPANRRAGRTEGRGSGESVPRTYSNPSNSSPRALNPTPKHPSTNLYVKNLLLSDTEATLREIFGPYGEIESVKVMSFRHMPLGRGVGFVRFKLLEQATHAVEAMNGITRGEARLIVQYADEDPARSKRRLSASTGAVPMPSSSGSIISEGYPSTVSHQTKSRTSSLEGRLEQGPQQSVGVVPAFPVTLAWAPYHQGAAPSLGWPPNIYPPHMMYDASSVPAPQWMLMYMNASSTAAPTAFDPAQQNAPIQPSSSHPARPMTSIAPQPLMGPYSYPMQPMYYPMMEHLMPHNESGLTPLADEHIYSSHHLPHPSSHSRNAQDHYAVHTAATKIHNLSSLPPSNPPHLSLPSDDLKADELSISATVIDATAGGTVGMSPRTVSSEALAKAGNSASPSPSSSHLTIHLPHSPRPTTGPHHQGAAIAGSDSSAPTGISADQSSTSASTSSPTATTFPACN